jgi:hypothetical protein
MKMTLSEKLAASKKKKERPSAGRRVGQAAAGTAAIGAGAVAAKKSIPKITGSRTFYHGTSDDIAAKIRAGGLRSANSVGDGKGVIHQGGFPKEWADDAYVAGSKIKAYLYGAQRVAANPGEGNIDVLKMRIKDWGDGPKVKQNPETAGGFSGFIGRTRERMAEQAKSHPDPHMRAQAAGTQNLPDWAFRPAFAFQNAGQEKAINHVPTSSIHGSKDYKKLSLGEIGQYAKAKPLRFAGGVALGAAGVGLAGYGANKIYRAIRPKSPAASAVAHPEGKQASALNPFVSREKRKALKKGDQLFAPDNDQRWEGFLEDAGRKSFVRALQNDPRADDKLKRHVDQMNRLKTGRVVGTVMGSGGRAYNIVRKRGGGLACTCPDWRYKKSTAVGKQECKHIKKSTQCLSCLRCWSRRTLRSGRQAMAPPRSWDRKPSSESPKTLSTT